MREYLLITLLVVSGINGTFGCGRSSTPATTPAPRTTTTTTTTRRPVVEENIEASSASQNNAWGGGGGIDWTYVAPGGSQSGSNRGTVSRPSSPSSPSGGSSSSSSRPSQSVSRGELRALSRDLVRADTNSVGSLVSINPQGKIRSRDTGDRAPEPLITLTNSRRVMAGPTISKFYSLLDNYNPSVTARESDSRQELSEQEAFLTAVSNTEVMRKTEQFLTSKGLISRPLKTVLKEIWFTPYTRHRSIVGSSGFEHVFVGEIKSGKVSGFHNWLSFYKEEQERDLDYLGYSKTHDLGDTGSVILLKFKWTQNSSKDIGSMFVGVSPELEMALYTVCFFARPGNNCPMEINNFRFNIKTHGQNYHGKNYVGTAYPNI